MKVLQIGGNIMLKLNEIFVIKRDGRKVPFDIKLIQQAIFKAAYRGKIDEKFIGSYHIDPFKSNGLANRVTEHVVIDIQNLNRDTVEIDDIQNIVVKNLNLVAPRVGKAYLAYKTEQNILR